MCVCVCVFFLSCFKYLLNLHAVSHKLETNKTVILNTSRSPTQTKERHRGKMKELTTRVKRHVCMHLGCFPLWSHLMIYTHFRINRDRGRDDRSTMLSKYTNVFLVLSLAHIKQVLQSLCPAFYILIVSFS